MESNQPTQASAHEAQQSAIDGDGPAPPARPRDPALSAASICAHGRDLDRAADTTLYRRRKGDPIYRPLRIFTSDPMRSRFEGGEAVVSIPYEPLGRGPAGAMVEIREEKGSPLADLESTKVQLNNGYPASASDPRFRQQMVYAVAVDVIAQFSLALGRDPTWGFDRARDRGKLRLRPHYGEMDNAFYSKASGEICFGYFEAKADAPGVLPKGWVYTALSQDVIAHEMAHALLDGMRSHFDDPSNADVLAFHEAFADIVAILHHFSHKESVRRGIDRAGGRLRGRQGFVFALAEQFGRAMGYNGPLRAMLNGSGDEMRRYESSDAPHERGSVLVEAVLEAVEMVFERRVRRVRTLYGLTGLRTAELHPAYRDLLADEASRVASQFLSLCIRAVDYCPPVDLTFGEYLRALVTADRDLVESDPIGYRECLIAAFARRGIFPGGVKDLGEDSLLWDRPKRRIVIEELGLTRLALGEDPGWGASRADLCEQADALGAAMARKGVAKCFGINPRGPKPTIESVRTLRRVGPDRQVRFGIVAEVLQRSEAKFGNEVREIWAGSTIVIGSGGEVRYVVHKKATDETRLEREFAYRKCSVGSVQNRMRGDGDELWRRLHGGRAGAAGPAGAAEGRPAAAPARREARSRRASS